MSIKINKIFNSKELSSRCSTQGVLFCRLSVLFTSSMLSVLLFFMTNDPNDRLKPLSFFNHLFIYIFHSWPNKIETSVSPIKLNRKTIERCIFFCFKKYKKCFTKRKFNSVKTICEQIIHKQNSKSHANNLAIKRISCCNFPFEVETNETKRNKKTIKSKKKTSLYWKFSLFNLQIICLGIWFFSELKSMSWLKTTVD